MIGEKFFSLLFGVRFGSKDRVLLLLACPKGDE